MTNIHYMDRDKQLKNILLRQPYDIQLNELDLHVERNVFPPDQGFTSRIVGDMLSNYTPETALDLGCGTGYLALILKKNGVHKVWASDNHLPAIKCTEINFDRNSNLGKIELIQSDLFRNIKDSVFELIVFTQPYYPSDGVFGLGPDGGKEIIIRFFESVDKHLASNGVILMPFSTIVEEIHNPAKIAKTHGFSAKPVIEITDLNTTHYVFEITKK